MFINTELGYMDFSNQCLKTINLFEDSTYSFEVETWYNAHNIKDILISIMMEIF